MSIPTKQHPFLYKQLNRPGEIDVDDGPLDLPVDHLVHQDREEEMEPLEPFHYRG
jgi:hypothetical protein